MPKVFSQDDYNSGDGMLTTVWGPSLWHYLHTMSFNYPVNPTCEDKKRYSDFIVNMQYVLPCGKCRKNLKKNFKKLPLKLCHMESRETFSTYIFELHELINRMLGKTSGLTYETVRDRYENFRSRCTKTVRVRARAQKPRRTRRKKAGEKGCTEPLYGEKSKCLIQIVPQNKNVETFQMDKSCMKRKAS